MTMTARNEFVVFRHRYALMCLSLNITDIDNNSSYRYVIDEQQYAVKFHKVLHCIHTLRVALPTH